MNRILSSGSEYCFALTDAQEPEALLGAMGLTLLTGSWARKDPLPVHTADAIADFDAAIRYDFDIPFKFVERTLRDDNDQDVTGLIPEYGVRNDELRQEIEDALSGAMDTLTKDPTATVSLSPRHTWLLGSLAAQVNDILRQPQGSRIYGPITPNDETLKDIGHYYQNYIA